MSDFGVEAMLNAAAANNTEDLTWRTSIVDMMKLLDIDASYANRKDLAEELGDTDDSGTTEDTIGPHKKAMQALARKWRQVPAALTD